MRRWAVLLLVLALVPAIGAAPASAWSNGRGGPNSYGSHDWILSQALSAPGARAGWVRDRVALKATDDPDMVDGIDHASGTWWHVWDEWGATYGGAPEAAEIWFDRARAQYRKGNLRRASRSVGILAHIVGDVGQPMHTDGSLDLEDSVHSSYEVAVDTRSEAGDTIYSFNYDGVTAAHPYRRTRRVARDAHQFYSELVNRYANSGYGARVHQITQRQLNKAANAMADLLRQIRR